MTFRRASLAATFAFVGILSATQSGCAAEEDEEVSESSEAITNGRIVVRQFDSPGPTIGKWGYDVKQDGRSKALRPALAKEIFGDIGMNLLRVAVRAADAHPAKGVANVKRGVYAEDIDAIKTAKGVKNGLDVFASVKLLGDKSFPAWVKDGGEVNAAKYAELLEDYLAFMKNEGVTIDFLGVDNERKFNEGNITPAKYNAIVRDVSSWCRAHDVKVPSFIAAEDYGPAEDTGWLQNLWDSPSKFQHADFIGVHTYSKHRNAGYVDALERLSNNTHGKRLWDSELHWNDKDDDDNVGFDDMKSGMLLAMDHFDHGFQAMTWWAFQPRSRGTKSSFVMSELVASTIGAATLPTDDMDGKTVALGKVNTRALKNGPKNVTLWVANFDNKAQKDQKTEIANQEVASASYVQWSPSSAAAGKTGNASLAAKNKSVFEMDYPANTITRVSITLK
jgi:O-glycosyl hydrolase